MKKTGKLLLAGWLAGLLSGCLSVDYVGQKLPALPENESVAFYDEATPMPPDTYHSIGRGLLECNGSTPSGEIKTALIDKARTVGANAVQVVEFKRTKVGAMAVPQDNTAGGPVSMIDAVSDQRVGGGSVYIDTFGNPVAYDTQMEDIYEITVKALFLVKLDRYDEVMAEWKEAQAKFLEMQSQALEEARQKQQ